MENHSNLSQLVREAIQRSGLSAYSLSWKTGLHADAVREFIQGTRDLRISSIDKLVQAIYPQGLQLVSQANDIGGAA
ncbi:MAG TPA: hypothetical protein VHV10_01050 [Ktedonobacteraceae bacterium]|nr:hypothetical protein [Ktedonobacteraceae bacterium]